MRVWSIKGLAFVLLLAWVFSVACSRDNTPPPPLAAEQLPAEFAKAFAKAPPSLKELAARVSSAVQAKDLLAAHEAIQVLCAAPEATKAQRTLADRAFLTITDLLKSAQAQGDEKAAETLRVYRSTR